MVKVVDFVVNSTLSSKSAHPIARTPSAPADTMVAVSSSSAALPATRRRRFSPHRRIERPAVEQKVLTDDEAGRSGAQKCAGIAEFGRIADPAGRVRLAALGEHLLERNVLPPGFVFDAGAQPVGQKRAGQQAVD